MGSAVSKNSSRAAPRTAVHNCRNKTIHGWRDKSSERFVDEFGGSDGIMGLEELYADGGVYMDGRVVTNGSFFKVDGPANKDQGVTTHDCSV